MPNHLIGEFFLVQTSCLVNIIFVFFSRAYGRIGNAYNKQGKLLEAIDAYNKSLVEHRTPEVLKKVQEVGFFGLIFM